MNVKQKLEQELWEFLLTGSFPFVWMNRALELGRIASKKQVRATLAKWMKDELVESTGLGNEEDLSEIRKDIPEMWRGSPYSARQYRRLQRHVKSFLEWRERNCLKAESVPFKPGMRSQMLLYRAEVFASMVDSVNSTFAASPSSSSSAPSEEIDESPEPLEPPPPESLDNSVRYFQKPFSQMSADEIREMNSFLLRERSGGVDPLMQLGTLWSMLGLNEGG